MRSEWRTYKVSEFADVIGGGTPKTKVPEYWNGSIPWLTPKDLSTHEGRYISKGERNISQKGLSKSSAKILPPKTVLLTGRAPVGYIAIAKNELTTNQGFRNLLVKDGFSPEFIYYLLFNNVEYLKRHASGSTFQELSGSTLKELQFDIPEKISEQRAIAHILGSLDDKIELNRRMNRTLEAMARAIFKSWFIDFDPVIDNALRAGNPIPDSMAARTEIRRQILDQNQPSSPDPFSQRAKGSNYRGGFDFSGLVKAARNLRKSQTSAEELLWNLLRNRQFMGLKFRRQHQIGDYIADFYCHEHLLVIELDGGIHLKKIEKDAKRDAYMKSLGLTVLRFQNEQLFNDIETVLEKIAKYINPLPMGEGLGEGSIDEIYGLFPDSFEDSELGEIPKGWAVRSLYDSANYINGAAYRNFHFTDEEGALPVIKIAELKNGVSGQTKFTKTELDDKNRISDGEILLSWSGNPDTSIGTFVWCGGPAWLNQHIFRVLPHHEIEKHFVLCLLKYLRPVFAEIARDKQTTGLGHFTVRDMKQLMVVHPSENILAKFNDSVGPIFDRWYNNLFELKTLASLRDTLLPKLISGEMRVPDAEKFVK